MLEGMEVKRFEDISVQNGECEEMKLNEMGRNELRGLCED